LGRAASCARCFGHRGFVLCPLHNILLVLLHSSQWNPTLIPTQPSLPRRKEVIFLVARGILLMEPAAAPPVLHVLLREMPLIAPQVPRLRCTITVAAAVLSLGFRWRRQAAFTGIMPATAAAQHASAEASLAHLLSPALSSSGGGGADGPCGELLACLVELYLATARELPGGMAAPAMLTDGPGRTTAWWSDVWAAVGRELAEVGAVCLTWAPSSVSNRDSSDAVYVVDAYLRLVSHFCSLTRSADVRR